MPKLLIISVFGICLSACVSKYTLPEGVPRSELTISSGDNAVFVQAFKNEKCEKTSNGNRLAYFYGELADPLAGVTKQIEAGKEFVYTYALKDGVAGITNTRSCVVTLVFNPLANYSYRTHFGLEKNGCYVTLERKEGDVWVKESNVRSLEETCFNALDG